MNLLPEAGFDVSLKLTLEEPKINGLENPLHSDKVGACFVYPPIGSTKPQLSHTRGPAAGLNQDQPCYVDFQRQWNEKNMRQGTRQLQWVSHELNKPWSQRRRNTSKYDWERKLYSFCPPLEAKSAKDNCLELTDVEWDLRWHPDPGEEEEGARG